MNLKFEILKEHSKRQAVKIGKWVGKDRARFKQLMDLFLHGEYRVTQRSAWIVSYCADEHPELIAPWLSGMVKRMQDPDVHVAVKRNVIRVLQTTKIPRPLLGTVMTLCFNELTSADSPIAVKANAITVLGNIAKEQPEINRELRATIGQVLLHATPGLRVRGERVLRQISLQEKPSTSTR